MSFEGKEILGLITARGGSKRLPRKNILPFSGKPLMAWTLAAAKASAYIDRLIVSTDDGDIMKVASEYGAEAPLRRPAALAEDSTRSEDVILHAMDWCESKGDRYDVLVLLQPTSPLRTAHHINEAIEQYFKSSADALVSVTTDEKGSQKLNGALYLAGWEFFRKNKSWYSGKIKYYWMDIVSSIDIDSAEDFVKGEQWMKTRVAQ